MKYITDFSNNTSEQEFFTFLYDKIFSGDIRTFSNLKEFTAPCLGNSWTHSVIMKAFELIKRLYWGFFNKISPVTHQKLWKELVIPDSDFSGAGDLKRTLQISNLYVAMLDIHGYTKFCMDSRKNLSMMHILDRSIEIEINRISSACGAISQRERGDEMVVVAASATDAITVTLAIIDYFGKTNILSDPDIITVRSEEAASLPVFNISAGITGGNTTSPLIITEKGNLSGFLLNSGARLQMLASQLSSDESRVMIARQVQMNFLKENTSSKSKLAGNQSFYFFDTGHIEFKGVMITASELIFNDKHKVKEKYSEEMTRLLGSIRENLWEQRIFCDLMELIAKAAFFMPKFSIAPPVQIEEITQITNESIVQITQMAEKAYLNDEDYLHAITILRQLIDISKNIPSFDRHILDYMIGIGEKYSMLLAAFRENIEKQIEANAGAIFQGSYHHAWAAAKKSISAYEKLHKMGMNSHLITNKKKIWFNLIKQKMNDLEFTLYCGKK